MYKLFGNPSSMYTVHFIMNLRQIKQSMTMFITFILANTQKSKLIEFDLSTAMANVNNMLSLDTLGH